MINIYQYYSKGFACNVLISYKDGVFHKAEVDSPEIDLVFSENNPANKKAFFFVYEQGFLEATKGSKGVIKIKREITFDMFWEKYDYKISGRFKTEKLWDTLSIGDKLSAFDFIKVYEGQLKLNNTAKLYATTYLNQKRWIK